MKKYLIIAAAPLFFNLQLNAQEAVLSGTVMNLKNEPIEDVFVYVEGIKGLQVTDQKGGFSFKLPDKTTYTLSFQSIGISTGAKEVFLDGDTDLTFSFKEEIQNLDEVVVQAASDPFGIRQLRSLEAGGLYEGKKTEVINIQLMTSNKATNNARQAYSKIPSLNVWESDCAGLQLDIGGRGLSPRRTSNFNVRQNGYDISADPLGYPESYYTPPLQAIEQIEIVRGAGALQYGSQFGGLINFKMRRGDTNKPVNVESENTYGSFNFFNTFNSIHGQYKKLNHYSYVQYKRGDCYRSNSGFDLYGAYSSLQYEATERLKVGLDFSHMYYLTQQGGGLTDEQFIEDHLQSTRSRNWFRVSWTLPALTFEYAVSQNVKIYSRTYGLASRRSSLGLLTTPDEDDSEDAGELPANRDLIDGKFRNVGNETRISLTYDTKKGLKNSLLVGARIFKGTTNFSQFLGTTGSNASFVRVDTAIADRRKSDFDFPSINAAIFAEKIVRLSSSFSLIPGFRYEYITTKAEGLRITPIEINSFDDVIEQESTSSEQSNRSVMLAGLGLSKKLNDRYELYANATSNYRAINFTDIQIQTNTQLVDTLIKDESGYSLDIGIRKQDFDPFFLEAGLFYLQYRDRIGEVLDDGLRVRTNIGDASIMGIELFSEVDIFKLARKNTAHKLTFFINGSVNRGIYTRVNTRAANVARSGNRLEEIPKYNIKTGLTYGIAQFSASVQATFLGEQFSDASNSSANITGLQETTGVFGEIPAYEVVDLSLKYQLSNHFVLSGSINNLFDEKFFTRRATAYPGPGIIPSAPRNYYLTLKVAF